MLQSMGMPATDVQVNLTSGKIADRPSMNVEIKINNLPLFGNGDICPIKIGLQDTATAICKGSASADAYRVMRNPRMGGYLVPVNKIPANGQSGLDAPIIAP